MIDLGPGDVALLDAALERRAGHRLGVSLPPPGQQQRQCDVLLHAEICQQHRLLEHQADVHPTPTGELLLLERADRHSIHVHRATAGAHEASQAVQQRGLASAARSHHRHTAAEWPPDQVQDPQAAERYLTEVARRVMAAFYAPRTAAIRLLVQSEAPRHPAALRLWREHAATPVWSPLVGNLARLAHAGALDLPDPVRAAGQFVTLVTGTTWQMTEFGTFATTDITQANPVELEQGLIANIRLFVRGHAPATTTVQ